MQRYRSWAGHPRFCSKRVIFYYLIQEVISGKYRKKMYSTCKSFSFHEQFSLTCAVSNEYPLNFFANLSDYIMIDVHTYIHTYTHIMQKYKKRQMLASRIVLTRRQAFDRFSDSFRFHSILSSDAILPTYWAHSITWPAFIFLTHGKWQHLL